MLGCSYGPPLGWQRGSRVVVIREGVRGVSETWIRQEDGSRMDLSECARLSTQGTCCGMSTAEVAKSTNSSTKFASYVDQTGFNSVYAQAPNKYDLYEAAFRLGLEKGSAAREHAKVDAVKI